MNTILKYFLILIVFISGIFLSCSDNLDTEPTDRFSGTTIFRDVTSAQTSIHGVYALFWRFVYVTGNQTQGYGHQSVILAQDVMAEDMLQRAFNWFGFDYQLDYTRTISVGTASRNYDVWNRLYTVISNANYIINSEETIQGDPAIVKNIVAQAYAMRAFCYFELIQGFQFTYLGNQTKPGVPIYTQPTVAGDEGKPRGTVEDVYTQINFDIERAIELFTEIGKPVQEHPSNIDYFVAKGFQSRIALVQGRWQDAFNAAAEARSKPELKLLSNTEIMTGFNRYTLPSTLWAMEMINDQSQIWASLYSFLDPEGGYGGNIRVCISRWLYDKIANPDFDDKRVDWFQPPIHGTNNTGINVNYGQMKRRFHTETNWVGDIIFMRAEEMLIIQAEAEARLGHYDEARALLNELAAVRLTTPEGLTAYDTYLNSLADAATLPTLTHVDPTNVLEEVIMQRRIELWGEIGRIKDILRLKQGYDRSYPGNNHTQFVTTVTTTKPENGAFLFKIPQTEFDGNVNISSEEQNPTD